MTLTFSSFIGAVALSIGALATSTAAQAAGYKIYDLGAIDALAINKRGQVVGVASGPTGQANPAIFELGAAPRFLNNLLGSGVAINKRSDVVGTFSDGQCCNKSFVTRDGVTTVAPTLGGLLGTGLNGINDHSTAIGFSFLGNVPHAVLWHKDGSFVDLGTWGGSSAMGRAINNAGTMIGTRFNGSTQMTEGVRVGSAGVVESLAARTGAAFKAEGFAINNKGDVAGQLWDTPDSTTAFVLQGNVTYRMALPGSQSGIAWAINDRGVAVGWSSVEGQTRAVLMDRGRVVDLSQLPEALAAGWRKLFDARAINDHGVIVGYGFKNTGDVGVFMLVPEHAHARSSDHHPR